MPCTGMLTDLLPILASFALGGALVYGLLHVLVLLGLQRGKRGGRATTASMSVIVAARNESATIGTLLESLDRQTRRPDEIVLVDDRSEDDTSAVAEAYRIRLPMLRVVRVDALPAGAAPKKHALERGIAASTGEVLCFTDADVILPPSWLATIGSHMGETADVVVGTYAPSRRTPPSAPSAALLFRFIDYEKYKSWLLAAGSIGWGFAWTASGSNLSYRRSVYEQVRGFEGQHVSISGDDDLFVQRVRRETDRVIVAMTDPAATVVTEVPSTWRAFYRQRTRHLSAGRWYDARSSAWLALYHMSNLVATMSLFAAVIWPGQPFLAAYAVKVCADLLLCAFGDLRVQRPRAWTWFLPLEFVNAFYLMTAGLLAWVTTPSWTEAQRR